MLSRGTRVRVPPRAAAARPFAPLKRIRRWDRAIRFTACNLLGFRDIVGGAPIDCPSCRPANGGSLHLQSPTPPRLGVRNQAPRRRKQGGKMFTRVLTSVAASLFLFATPHAQGGSCGGVGTGVLEIEAVGNQPIGAGSAVIVSVFD